MNATTPGRGPITSGLTASKHHTWDNWFTPAVFVHVCPQAGTVIRHRPQRWQRHTSSRLWGHPFTWKLRFTPLFRQEDASCVGVNAEEKCSRCRSLQQETPMRSCVHLPIPPSRHIDSSRVYIFDQHVAEVTCVKVATCRRFSKTVAYFTVLSWLKAFPDFQVHFMVSGCPWLVFEFYDQ